MTSWLPSLNTSLINLGGDPLDPDSVVSPGYDSIFDGLVRATNPMPLRWKKPVDYDDKRTAFMLRRTEYSVDLAKYVRSSTAILAAAPDGGPFTHLPIFDQARRYFSDANLRTAIWSHLAGLIPQDEPIILVGHSLGSIVALDIVKRLKSARIPLLITLGSPLGALRSARRNFALDVFPYDRIDCWVNVFDPQDPVVMGKGVGRYYEAALDIPVSQNHVAPQVAQHGAAGYFEHPVVAAAIKAAIVRGGFATDLAARVQLEPSVRLPMLQFAYLQALQTAIDPADVKRGRALQSAREFLAARFEQLAMDAGWDVSKAQALRLTLMKDALATVRGKLTDDELVMLAIALAGQPPAQPFDIEAESGDPARRIALQQLLDIARSPAGEVTRRDGSSSSNVSDAAFADAVLAAIRESSTAGGMRVLPVLLVGAGLIVLAATGIGLAAAVPTALVGGAAVTSTLAAFGPGGMVGGMAALAALTGTGSAATAAGMVAGVQGPGRQSEGREAWPILIQAVVSSTPAQLRMVVADLKAYVLVCEKLELTSPAANVQFAVETAASSFAPEVAAHRVIAPRSARTKANVEKLDILGEFSTWLDQYIPGRREVLADIRSISAPARR